MTEPNEHTPEQAKARARLAMLADQLRMRRTRSGLARKARPIRVMHGRVFIELVGNGREVKLYIE